MDLSSPSTSAQVSLYLSSPSTSAQVFLCHGNIHGSINNTNGQVQCVRAFLVSGDFTLPMKPMAKVSQRVKLRVNLEQESKGNIFNWQPASTQPWANEIAFFNFLALSVPMQ